MFSKLLNILLLIVAIIRCADEADRVTNLFESDLYSNSIYSGYLDTKDANRKLHYLFLPSQGDPSNDPVVLWLNGGPGCSSLLGFIQEHGPVVVPDFTRDLIRNKFSWNNLANMIYLESPAGVGFSYNDNGDADKHYDDAKSGEDNRRALVHFFTKFPEYANNPFYIAGESYAGVYVPTLASLILRNPQNPFNLKGIIVGNGLTDYTVDVEKALIDFAWDHSLYSPSTRSKLLKECNTTTTNVSHACNEARQEIQNAMQGLNIYDIYRECPQDPANKTSTSSDRAMINTLKKISKTQKMNYLTFLDNDNDLEEPVGIWPNGCKDDPYPTEFLNLNTTKAALHVRDSIQWAQCNDSINEWYIKTDASLALYPQLFDAGLKVWFYSGDTDAAVPFTGTVKWLPKLHLKIEEAYKPWFVKGQVAGFIQIYDKMTYVTVKGTGHMAPQWKREESYAMFRAYLLDVPLA